MWVSLPSDKLYDLQHLVHSLVLKHSVEICQVMFILARPVFVPVATPNFDDGIMLIKVTC